ncbi:MAG: TatD family hydrolase [Candidatus Thorarchaeota archaeon]
MLIDTHAHLNLYLYKRFGSEIKSIIKEIEQNKILTISNSMDITSYRINKKISKSSSYIIPSFGIHPWTANKYVNKIGLIKKMINKNNMIGEIGLDFFFIKDKNKYPGQRKIFKLFLSECKDKIISIHTKGAELEVLDLLEEFGNTRVIIHWYQGDINILKKMIKLGCYFTIGPEIHISDHIKKIAKIIPNNRLLTETDNPGGTNSLFGKKGSPILIKEVVTELSNVKGKTAEEIEKQVQMNFSELIDGIISISV